ncbi:hypothetical protein DL546_001748 [Coniochaeta pulveracea]|uniref:Uncharacterized protein n=1 Tax=Coniochaeta pulveracea TaxID=177199 RepID=A0A420YJZ6_9PEZI|nr:hypothetical protein DL546_001748 [Coniochaeta pulveracea]
MDISQNTNLRTILSTSLDPSNLPPIPASGQHILGLHFPQSSHAPEPIWIPLSSSTDEETSITFQSVDVSSIFPPDIHPEVLYSDSNRVRNRDTESMLEVWTLPPSVSSTQPNICITGLLKLLSPHGGKPNGTKDWRGPVLALAMTRATGFMVDPGSYKDLTLRDAEDVVDFLASHGGVIRGPGFWDGVDGHGTEATPDVGPERNGMEERNRTAEDEDGLEMRCKCGEEDAV